MPRLYLAYQRGDRDKHLGPSGGDTLKAKDGENTKTTTGGFDPDGPNLDYVGGGDGSDTCYVDPGDTYVNCQVLYIQQPVSSITAATTEGASTKPVKATKVDGVILKEDNKPRTAPDPSMEQ
jgi:hypothetical protein